MDQAREPASPPGTVDARDSPVADATPANAPAPARARGGDAPPAEERILASSTRRSDARNDPDVATRELEDDAAGESGRDDDAMPAAVTVAPDAPEGAECRICLMDDPPFCSPCKCKGSMSYVHVACLARWCTETGVTSCELCMRSFPGYFANAGRSARRERAREEDERRAATDRLHAQALNFHAAYGRLPSTTLDFAMINLNTMLEAEASLRRNDASEGSVQVVVIDANGRARTITSRNVAELNARARGVPGIPDARDTGIHPATLSQIRALHHELSSRVDHDDPGSRERGRERDAAAERFAFWMRMFISVAIAFVVLYVVIAVFAGSDYDSPVFTMRVFGLFLAVMLLARVVQVFKQRSEDSEANQIEQILEWHAVAREENLRASGAGGSGGRSARRVEIL